MAVQKVGVATALWSIRYSMYGQVEQAQACQRTFPKDNNMQGNAMPSIIVEV